MICIKARHSPSKSVSAATSWAARCGNADSIKIGSSRDSSRAVTPGPLAGAAGGFKSRLADDGSDRGDPLDRLVAPLAQQLPEDIGIDLGIGERAAEARQPFGQRLEQGVAPIRDGAAGVEQHGPSR